jgi:hypothetical protein
MILADSRPSSHFTGRRMLVSSSGDAPNDHLSHSPSPNQ